MRTMIVVLILASAAASQERPNKKQMAVQQVLQAHRAGEQAVLKTLAEVDDPDPWFVADELSQRGEHDAAEAFARAAPRKDVEALVPYLTSQRRRPPRTAAYAAFAVVEEAEKSMDASAALAAHAKVDTRPLDVVSLRVHTGQASILAEIGRHADALKEFLAAADVAERLGWPAGASRLLQQGALAALRASDQNAALRASERRVAIEETRENETALAGSLYSAGFMNHRLGAYSRAIGFLTRARTLSEKLGLPVYVGRSSQVLGMAYLRRGDHDKAAECAGIALEARRAIPDRRGIANGIHLMGRIDDARGNWRDALRSYEEAGVIFHDLRDWVGLANATSNRAAIHREHLDARENCQGSARENRTSPSSPSCPQFLRASPSLSPSRIV